MTLEPLFHAPLAVQIHVAAVTPAAFLGAYLLLRPKGTPLHRFLGRSWLAFMVVTALSSFFIHQLDLFYGYSPIHLLSIATLFGSWRAIAAARRRDIRTHMRIVRSLYLGGIVVAGLFTFVPGRIMHAVAFGGSAWRAALFALLILLVLALIVAHSARRKRVA